ncbi:MAG: oligosaccharide flippase family protein [Bacteroidales bacterium]|nr:oligosaccharide flippase family protein [Bacteroidales bacterium]
MNQIKQLAGQAAIYGLPTILARFLNYLLVPLYTRVFIPEEYAVVTEMYAYVAFLFVVLTYGMETAFFRFTQKENGESDVYSTTVWSLIGTTTIFLLAVILFSGSIAHALEYPNHPEYIIWFAMILSFDAVSAIPYARIRLENRAKKFALIKSANIAINIGLNLLFILLFPYILENSSNQTLVRFIDLIYTEEIGVGYIFIANLAASGITLLMLSPVLLKIKRIFQRVLWKRMLRYALPLLILGLAGIVNETFDRILLKHLIPESENPMRQLGIYGACYKVAMLMTLFVQTFRYAAEPFFFNKMGQKDAKELYATVMKYFVMVTSLIFLGIMMYIDIVMKFIGEEFRIGIDVVPILLMANLFLGIFYNLSIWFKFTGKTMHGALIAIMGAVITLVFNFILVPEIGYMGAAWATFICYAAMMIVSYFVGRKHYPVDYNVGKIVLYVGLSVVLYLLSNWIEIKDQSQELIINTLFLLTYVLIIIAIERRNLIKLV